MTLELVFDATLEFARGHIIQIEILAKFEIDIK